MKDMTFSDLIGATVIEADGAGIRVRLSNGRETEIFPTTERIGSLDCPVLFAYNPGAA